ncbi:MAG: photosynthetic reaction center cytochrome PufC [Myxococcota bacterium]
MSMRTANFRGVGFLVLACSLVALAGCEPPPVESRQIHFRGLGMEEVSTRRELAAKAEANRPPASLPPVNPANIPASQLFQNLQVVGHVDAAEFTRLMGSITAWVSPQQGCAYCHAGSNFALDDVYTKSVARRMLQMTIEINTQWKDHVGDTGVTCYTCHRGNAVPTQHWTKPTEPRKARGPAGGKAGQNQPAMLVGLTSLPTDPFSAYLLGDMPVRLQSTEALPSGNRSSIKQAEWTYGFMMHISTALGVNCGHCHNSRSFGPWEASTPARVKAWHGIQMVRSLNQSYLEPLAGILPAARRGPHGDAFKINCATCHQGASKPLLGVSMLADHPELATSAPPPAATPAPTDPAAQPPVEGDAAPPAVSASEEPEAVRS